MTAPALRVVRDVVTVAALAEHLSINAGTVRDYESKAKAQREAGIEYPGQIPKRDGLIDGRARGWKLETIVAWLPHRPGRGARIDQQLAPEQRPVLHRTRLRRPQDKTAVSAV